MYYWEAPVKYRRVRLGRAVAASACVPALFDPIQMDGLFPKRTVALVDGGVHDNQGTASLTEQECSVIMVSDASGQMGSTLQPSGEALQISMRANNVLMAGFVKRNSRSWMVVGVRDSSGDSHSCT